MFAAATSNADPSMSDTPPQSRIHDPLAAKLNAADDRVLLTHGLPPQAGVVPKVRFGRHWVSVLWTLPPIFVLLVIGVAVSRALRQAPAVQEFVQRYPGIPASARSVTTGFLR